jgi:LPXTG-site transpeptidase (sortase) family protein
MPSTLPPRRATGRIAALLPALLVAIVLAGSLTAASPATADARTYVKVSSLTKATKVDKVVVSRVNISLPVRKGVIGGTVLERVAYHYPGTSWPGGGSNTYFYAHARAGSFLNLKYMRAGDIVRLRLVSGVWVRYKVTIVKRVRWNDGKWTLLTSSERLTLQTCTGNTKTADRLVVVAVPLD